MDDLTKGWLVLWCSVFICSMITIVSCTYLGYCVPIAQFVSAGYEQVTVVGSGMVVWQKVK